MCQLLWNKWSLFVLRGLLAIPFGLLASMRPDAALAASVALYGFFP
ncbi:MAG: hypothetical protein KF884_09825 [Fimbriimonadaceae bacterium]|nr:hypothetical protein [Fimbriimonadaceae bacterium]QYK57845.1 MAG: hypothetical protein KF884_09825 [Fimbriimonadaceae bacterium]